MDLEIIPLMCSSILSFTIYAIYDRNLNLMTYLMITHLSRNNLIYVTKIFHSHNTFWICQLFGLIFFRVSSCLIDMTFFFFLIDHIISLKETRLLLLHISFSFQSKVHPQGIPKLLLNFFANFSLVFFIKVLLIKKILSSSLLTLFTIFLILFLAFDIFFFSSDFLEKQNFGNPCVFHKETWVSAFIFNLTLLR